MYLWIGVILLDEELVHDCLTLEHRISLSLHQQMYVVLLKILHDVGLVGLHSLYEGVRLDESFLVQLYLKEDEQDLDAVLRVDLSD